MIFFIAARLCVRIYIALCASFFCPTVMKQDNESTWRRDEGKQESGYEHNRATLLFFFFFWFSTPDCGEQQAVLHGNWLDLGTLGGLLCLASRLFYDLEPTFWVVSPSVISLFYCYSPPARPSFLLYFVPGRQRQEKPTQWPNLFFVLFFGLSIPNLVKKTPKKQQQTKCH